MKNIFLLSAALINIVAVFCDVSDAAAPRADVDRTNVIPAAFTPEDERIRVEHDYRELVKSGDSDGLIRLAESLLTGRRSKDISQAVYAIANQLYFHTPERHVRDWTENPQPLNGRFTISERSLLAAAKLRNPTAQAILAMFVFALQDRTTDKTIRRRLSWAAAYWAIESADQGNRFGLGTYGECVYSGVGFPQDSERAVQLFKQAADQNDVRGQFYYGLCLLEGHGVEKNPSEARRYLEQAAAQGDEDARRILSGDYKTLPRH
jgi:TPR repeat protein